MKKANLYHSLLGVVCMQRFSAKVLGGWDNVRLLR